MAAIRMPARRLTQPINDARALTAALRQDGFEVDVVEDANKEDMRRAVDRLKSKVQRDSVVMLFYSGYGIQAGRESYMIPVDAAIWKEGDVRRHGTSIESAARRAEGSWRAREPGRARCVAQEPVRAPFPHLLARPCARSTRRRTR